MSLTQYIRLVSRRLFVIGLVSLVIGLYLGITGGFDGMATLMTVAGAIVGVVCGAIYFFFPDESS